MSKTLWGPTGLRSLGWPHSRGTRPREEVRDGPHSDNRGGGNCGGVAPTAAPLRSRTGALRGSGLYNAPRPRFVDPSRRGLRFTPVLCRRVFLMYRLA
jgi:hypothetical protein